MAAIIPFDTEAEALSIANGTEYGLVARRCGRPTSGARTVSSGIEAGSIWVNTYRFLRPSVPYGGMKVSGLGRENGIEAIDSYLETKVTVIGLNAEYPDALTN